MLPLAPGLFSTTTGWPSSGLSGSASVRAIRSGVDPAEKPTRMRNGRFGQALAASLWAVAVRPPTRVRRGGGEEEASFDHAALYHAAFPG